MERRKGEEKGGNKKEGGTEGETEGEREVTANGGRKGTEKTVVKLKAATPPPSWI